MEDPVNEIGAVILTLTTAVNSEVQKAAITRYFAPDASFRHPLCTVPSSSSPPEQWSPSIASYFTISQMLSPTFLLTSSSRDTILRIYQWYRVMSPRIIIDIENVTYSEEKLELFVELVQTFHIRWNPLPPAQSRLLTHVNLRKVPPTEPGSKSAHDVYIITAQEDFYHPEDLISFVVPPLALFVHFILLLGTWASVLGAWLGAVLGYWSVSTGEGGKGVVLQPAGEPLPPQTDAERKDLDSGESGGDKINS